MPSNDVYIYGAIQTYIDRCPSHRFDQQRREKKDAKYSQSNYIPDRDVFLDKTKRKKNRVFENRLETTMCLKCIRGIREYRLYQMTQNNTIPQ